MNERSVVLFASKRLKTILRISTEVRWRMRRKKNNSNTTKVKETYWKTFCTYGKKARILMLVQIYKICNKYTQTFVHNHNNCMFFFSKQKVYLCRLWARYVKSAKVRTQRSRFRMVRNVHLIHWGFCIEMEKTA